MKQADALAGALYRHTKSHRLYRVVGVAMSAERPTERRVIYQQLAASKLRECPRMLPKGTLWSRKERSFLYVDHCGVPRFQYLHERVDH